MTQDEMIIRITNEILHQVDVEGIRSCIKMAYAIGFDEGNKSRSNQKEVMQLSIGQNVPRS
jgi:hypothetical protein